MARRRYNKKETIKKGYAADSIRARKAKEYRYEGQYSAAAQKVFEAIDIAFGNEEIDLNTATSVINYKLNTGTVREESSKLTQLLTRLHSDNFYYADMSKAKFGPNTAIEQAIDFNNKINYTQQGVMTFASYTNVIDSYNRLQEMKGKAGHYLYLFDTETVGGTNASKIWNPLDITEFAMQKVDLATGEVTKTNIVMGLDDSFEMKQKVEKILNALGSTLNDPELGDVKLTNDPSIIMNDEELRVTAYRLGLYGDSNTVLEMGPNGYMEAKQLADGDMNDWLNPEKIKKGWQRNVAARKASPMTDIGLNVADKTFIDSVSEMYNAAQAKTGMIGGQNIVPFDFKVVNTKIARMKQNLQSIVDAGGNISVTKAQAEAGLAYINKAFRGAPGLSAPSEQIFDTLPMINFIKEYFGIDALYNKDKKAIMNAMNGLAKQENIGAVWFPEFFAQANAHMADFDVDVQRLLFTSPIESLGNKTFMEHFFEVEQGGLKNLNLKVQKIKAGDQAQVFYAKKGTRDFTYGGKSALDHTYNRRTGEIFTGSNYEIMGPNNVPVFNGEINMGTHINKGQFYYLDSIKELDVNNLPKDFNDVLPELSGNKIYQVRMRMAVADKYKGQGLEDLEYVFHFGSEYELSGFFSSRFDMPLVKDENGKYVLNGDNALEILEQVRLKDGVLERDPGFYLRSPEEMLQAALEPRNRKTLNDKALRDIQDPDKHLKRIRTQVQLRKTLSAAGVNDVTEDEIVDLLNGKTIDKMSGLNKRQQHNLLAQLKKIAGFNPKDGTTATKLYSNTINKIGAAWNFAGSQDPFYSKVLENLEIQAKNRKWTQEQQKLIFDRVVENLKAQVVSSMDISDEKMKNLVYNIKSFEGSLSEINKIYDVVLPDGFAIEQPRKKSIITGSNLDADKNILTIRWGDKSSSFNLINQVTGAKFGDRDIAQNAEKFQRISMYQFTEHLKTLDDFKNNQYIKDAWKHMNADTENYNLVYVAEQIIHGMDEVKKADPSKGLIKDINIRALLEAVGDTDYLERVNGVSVSNIINAFENTQVPLDLTKIKRGKGNRKKYLENYIKDNVLHNYLPTREAFNNTLEGLTEDQRYLKTLLYDTVEKQILGSLTEITDTLSSIPNSDLSILPDGRFVYSKGGEAITLDSIPKIKLDGSTLYGVVDNSNLQLHLDLAFDNNNSMYISTNLGQSYDMNKSLAYGIRKRVEDGTFRTEDVYTLTSHLSKQFREESRYEFKSSDWYSNFYVGTGNVDPLLPRIFSKDGDLRDWQGSITIPDKIKAVLAEQFANPDVEIDPKNLDPKINQFLIDYRIELIRNLANKAGSIDAQKVSDKLTIGTKGKSKLVHGILMGANMRFEVGALNLQENLGRPVVDGAGNVKFIRSNQIQEAANRIKANFYEGALLETDATDKINRKIADGVGDVITGFTSRTAYVGEVGLKIILENNFDTVMKNNSVARLTAEKKENIYKNMFAYVNTFEQQKVFDARTFDAVTGGTMAANTVKLSSAKDFVNVTKDELHLDKYERMLRLVGDIEMTPEGVINYKSATGEIVKYGDTLIPYASFGGGSENWTTKMHKGLMTYQVTNKQNIKLTDEEISKILNEKKDLFKGIDFTKKDLKTKAKIINIMNQALEDYEVNYAVEDINRMQLPKILANDSEKSMNHILYAKTGTIDASVAKVFRDYSEETAALLQGTVLTPQALEAFFSDIDKRNAVLNAAGFRSWESFKRAWETEMYSMSDMLFGKGGIFEGFTDISNDNILGHDNRGTMLIGSVDESISMLGKYLNGGVESLDSRDKGIKEFIDMYNNSDEFQFFRSGTGSKGINLEYRDGRLGLEGGRSLSGALDEADYIDYERLEKLVRNIDDFLVSKNAKQEDRLVHNVIKNKDTGEWKIVAEGTENSEQVVGRMLFSKNKDGDDIIVGSIASNYHKIVNDPETQSGMSQEYFDSKLKYLNLKAEKANIENGLKQIEDGSVLMDDDIILEKKARLVQIEAEMNELGEFISNIEGTNSHPFRIGDQEEKIIKNYFINKDSFAALQKNIEEGNVSQEAVNAMEGLRGLDRSKYMEKGKMVYEDFLNEIHSQKYYNKYIDSQELTLDMVNTEKYAHLKNTFMNIMGADGTGTRYSNGKLRAEKLGLETAEIIHSLDMARLADDFNNGRQDIEMLEKAKYIKMTPAEYVLTFGDPSVPGYENIVKQNVLLELDMGNGKIERVAVPGMGSVVDGAEIKQDWHTHATRLSNIYQKEFLPAHGNPIDAPKIVEKMNKAMIDLKESTSQFLKKGTVAHDLSKLEVHAAVDRVKIISTMNDPNNPLMQQAMISGKSLAEWTKEGVYHDYAFDSLESFEKRGYFDKKFLDSMNMSKEDMIQHLRTHGTIMMDDRYPNIRERSLTPVRHYLAVDDKGMSFLASNATMMAPHTMLAMNADSDGDSVSRFLVKHENIDHVQYGVAKARAVEAVDAAGGYANDAEREAAIKAKTIASMKGMGISEKLAEEAYIVFQEREANMDILAATENNTRWAEAVKDTWESDYKKTRAANSILNGGQYSGAEVRGGRSVFGHTSFNALTETPTWEQVEKNMNQVNKMIGTIQENAHLLSEETRKYAKDLLEGSSDIFQHNDEAKTLDQALVAYKELMNTTSGVTQEGFDMMQDAATKRVRINKYHIEGMKKLGVTATGNVNSSLYGISQAIKAHHGDIYSPLYDEIMRSITSEMAYLLEESPISGKKHEIKAGDTRLIEFGDLFRRAEKDAKSHGLSDSTRADMEAYFKKYMNAKEIVTAYNSTMDRVGSTQRLTDTDEIVNEMVSKFTTYIGQALDPNSPMYADVMGHRESGRKHARTGTIPKLLGKADPSKSLMAEALDDIGSIPGASAKISPDVVKTTMADNAKKAINDFEPPKVDNTKKAVSEAIESGGNKIAKSLMNSSGGNLGRNLAVGALSVAAGLLVSGYASGNPLNDPDPATIDQKGYEGVQAAPEMMFSSGQGFAPNNTGGYIINIKGDTRKGNRQLKKALRQATKNAIGPSSINMSVKTTQSSGVYSDRDIENILNNYF